MKLKEKAKHDEGDQFRNNRLRYALCRGKEEHGKKLRRRIRRRFVKVKKIGFVVRQHR
jgi:hypothetical protein